MTSSYLNKTSAAETAIGFDYQFYYCFLLMLGIESDQTITFEDKDDIAIELNNGNIVLIQTKHTLQTNYQSDPINLTERDHDLW
ncbi:hypothetical protein [Flavihumibacter petaseus]|uniref:NERD domain-containing protein n=1 Tax=Flavihumibacter petaseus NBRC 106054 TaxID=1220578 RepID=A0A0E9MYY7_9BACT|nr:hypothetical protein [Flavihumibacter petaseus]GAO42325.1 hypothetical protein FPE01S_01_13390 [Flavihumibacter petaseus NBRC 106054]